MSEQDPEKRNALDLPILDALAATARGLAPEVEAELVALREACFRSEDPHGGVRAFAEKRPPPWHGR